MNTIHRLLTGLALTLLLALFGAAPAFASGEALSLSVPSAMPGSKTNATISINNVADIEGFSLVLNFSAGFTLSLPASPTPIPFTRGDYFPTAPFSASFSGTNLNDYRVTTDGTKVFISGFKPSGATGTIGTIEFNVSANAAVGDTQAVTLTGQYFSKATQQVITLLPVSQTFTVGGGTTTSVCSLSASPTSINAGDRSTLTASCTPAVTSYVWTGGTCAGTTGATCAVTPSVTTTYTVAGTNAGGTGAAASAMVTVGTPNAPVCNLSANPASITAGGSSTLTATCSPTATSFIWTGGTCAGTSAATCKVSPLVTTTYSVTGVNASGTNAAVSVTVSVSVSVGGECKITLSPDSVILGGTAIQRSVSVTTSSPTCAWTATSYNDWIRIPSGASGVGSGTVSYSVDAINGTTERTGTIMIAGKTFTINQKPSPDFCNTPPAANVEGSSISGNGQITGTTGTNFIYGGDGIDTMNYRCSYANFVVLRRNSDWTLNTTIKGDDYWTVNSIAEGNDYLTKVERIQFADGMLGLDIDTNSGQAYRIYQAAFNRKPDNGGLKYWIAQMDKGMDLQEVSARFIDSKEFKDQYGTDSTNVLFVTLLYKNVLHREPDQDGFLWWVDQLDKKLKARPKVLADFSESDENKLQVLPTIGNGIWLPN